MQSVNHPLGGEKGIFLRSLKPTGRPLIEQMLSRPPSPSLCWLRDASLPHVLDAAIPQTIPGAASPAARPPPPRRFSAVSCGQLTRGPDERDI